MQPESLTPASIISMLLSGFPSSQSTDVDGQMMAYLVAIEGYTIEEMVQAMKAFLSGRVKRENKTFAPSAPEFAEECRAQSLIIAAERRPRIEPPKPKDDGPPVDPRKLQLLNKALRGHNPSRAKLRKMFPHLDIPDVPVPEADQP